MPAMSWWLLALPLLAGALMPLQAGINGQLANHISSVLAASLISFVIGTLALLVLTVWQREVPMLGAFKGLTWWHWTGGLLGAFFIATAAFTGPKVGALLFMVLIIAGQLSMAITLDHFGWAGFRESPVSLSKIGGLLLIVAGIWLIRRG
jgi:transporter family-2 protein